MCVCVHECVVCIWRGVCECDRGGRGGETHVEGGNRVNVYTMTRSDYRYKNNQLTNFHCQKVSSVYRVRVDHSRTSLASYPGRS